MGLVKDELCSLGVFLHHVGVQSKGIRPEVDRLTHGRPRSIPRAESVCVLIPGQMFLYQAKGATSGILRKPRGLDATMGSPKLDQMKSQHLFNCSENIY